MYTKFHPPGYVNQLNSTAVAKMFSKLILELCSIHFGRCTFGNRGFYCIRGYSIAVNFRDLLDISMCYISLTRIVAKISNDWQYHNSLSFYDSLFLLCLRISNREIRMAEMPVLNGYAPFPILLTGSTHS